jgi:hypothetical protein
MSEKVSNPSKFKTPFVASAGLRHERGPRTCQQECEELQPVRNLQSDTVTLRGWKDRCGGRISEAGV